MSMSNYHRLTDIDEEADALWDQLNDEQSREVQQHQSRFRAPGGRSRSHPWVILQSMLWNTAERTGVAVTSAWGAAREAWQSHPHRHNRSNNTDMDFDLQFGIQDLQPNPALEERDHEEGRPNPGYPFVVLQQYPSRRAIAQEKDHWGIVSNMDVFLSSLYQFYYHRGMGPLICKFLVEFVSLLFTLWLSRIVLQKVDWHQLATCKDEHTCHANWSEYYYNHELSSSHWCLVQGYTILFIAYTSFTVWSFWQSLQQAWKCQFIVHEKLGISRRKLQGGAVSWDEVVQKLVSAQDSGEYRTTLSRLDPLLIAQRIMRKENFLIAFWNQKLLDVQIGNRQYWCPTLEWSIHVCILNHLFNHKYEIRPAFVLDATALQRRFIVCGVVHALLLPFLMLFVTFHFLLRNVYDFKTQKQYMGNKQWSTVAQWTFREFNELPHVLERRLEPSYLASEQYLKLFGQSEYIAALGKLLTFVGGAVGGVLVVLGVLNDAILLHVQLWGRNLLWYAGIAAGVYSIGRSLVPTKESQPSVTRNLFADMDAALQAVAKHTHYYPEHWKGRGWDQKVNSQFGLLFDSKVKLFLWELMALILAPYILIAKLSSSAPAICEFCANMKTKVPGAGDVCGYSTFDFEKFKDEAWDGKTMGDSIVHESAERDGESLVESIMRTGNLEEATRNHPKPRSRDGKMEKSFFGFKAAHPSWTCGPSGQSLVDRVEEYRQAELATISREQTLYIEAATRQLDTLKKLEDARQKNLAKTTATPDIATEHAGADAGSHPSPQLGPVPAPTATTTRLGESNSPNVKVEPSVEHREPNNGAIHAGPSRTDISPELHRLLALSAVGNAEATNLSESFRGSLEDDMPTRTAQRQYYWLERFHEHLERQQQHASTMSMPTGIGYASSTTASVGARSMPPAGQSQEDSIHQRNESHGQHLNGDD